MQSLLANSYIEVGLSYVSVFLAIKIIIRNKWMKLQLSFKGNANKYWVLGTVFFAIGLHIIISLVANYLRIIFPMSLFWREIFQGYSELPIYMLVLQTVITASVVEELFMRGLIARGLANKYSQRKAILFTAVLFGAAHLNIWQFVTAYVLGLFVTWLYLTTNALLLSMLAHAVHNGIGFFIGGVLGWQIPGYTVAGSHQPLWFSTMGILFIIIGAFLFSKANHANHRGLNNSLII